MGKELLDKCSKFIGSTTQENNALTLTELAEKYGESIDNLPMDVLMEAIYNERNAPTAGVLHQHESEDTKKET